MGVAPLGNCRDVSSGREHVHLVGEQVHAQGVQELLRILQLALPLHELPQPDEALIAGIDAALPFFVLPVRRDPFLRHAVHVSGPDLDLHRIPLRPDDGRVKRLITVALRDRDEILEAVRDGFPEGMDDAQGSVAILEGTGDDPDRGQVVDLVELFLLIVHLLVDAVEVFRAAGDLRFDLDFGQLAFEKADRLVDVPFTLLPFARDQRREVVIRLRVEMPQRQIFQFGLDPRDPQPVRQGGIDVQRLLGDEAPFRVRQRVQRPHVVQPIRQLDENHPDVLGHRQDHLPDILGLGLFTGAEGNPGQLGHPVHHRRHLGAEELLDLGQRGVGVLHRVVEQAGGDGARVQAQLGENAGDFERMREVGLARDALLPLVGLRGEHIGAHDRLHVRLRVVLVNTVQHAFDPHAVAYLR